MTDISQVYMLLGVAGVFLAINIYCLNNGAVDVISIFSMSVSMVLCFLISGWYIDGSLMSTTDGVTTVIRNLAINRLFMFIGVVLAIVTLLQLWSLMNNAKILSEFDYNDGDE